MTVPDVLALIEALITRGDTLAIAPLADIFEEAGYQETAELLRRGFGCSVVWGAPDWIRDIYTGPVMACASGICDYVFSTAAERDGFLQAFRERDGWSEGYAGTREAVERRVRSMFDSYPDDAGEEDADDDPVTEKRSFLFTDIDLGINAGEDT